MQNNCTGSCFGQALNLCTVPFCYVPNLCITHHICSPCKAVLNLCVKLCIAPNPATDIFKIAENSIAMKFQHLIILHQNKNTKEEEPNVHTMVEVH